MADLDYTFGGQLEWTIEAQNFETDIAAEAIQREIEATRETWTPLEKELIIQLTILLSCTRSVAFVGDKKPAPAVLKMIQVINNPQHPAELIAWRLKLPYKLRDAWMAAWVDAQDMFSVPVDQLPTDALTPSQQDELKDKNSFLATSA